MLPKRTEVVVGRHEVQGRASLRQLGVGQAGGRLEPGALARHQEGLVHLHLGHLRLPVGVWGWGWEAGGGQGGGAGPGPAGVAMKGPGASLASP